MRKRLTQQICERAAYQGNAAARGPTWIWDTHTPGLALRISPGGGKSWVFRYVTRDGKKRQLRLAPFARMKLDKAREDAARQLGAVADARDPVAEVQEKRRRKTIADLCDAYEKHHLPNLRAPQRPERVVALLRKRWGKRQIDSVKRAELAALHHEIGERPRGERTKAAREEARRLAQFGGKYEANRVVTILAKIFALAEAWGLVPEGTPNPARRIDRFREEKRDRWVTHAELPRLFTAIESYPHIYVRAALLFDLVTGCRIGEVLGARWDQIDRDRRELRIPTPKQGKPHIVPLSEAAMRILDGVPPQEGNPYVFVGARHGRPLVNVQKSWDVIRKAAGMPDVRLHDLRRTVGSWMAVDGASLVVIGKALGHTQPSTTAVYARLSGDVVRDALERHGERLLAVAGKREAAPVVKMKRKSGKRRAKGAA